MELNDYWKSSPPVHVSVAGYLGIKPASRKNTSNPVAEAAAELGAARAFVPRVPIQKVMPDERILTDIQDLRGRQPDQTGA